MAASAFASYLKDLMNMFDGRTGLALTSYNLGEGAIMDVMEQVAKKKGIKKEHMKLEDILDYIPSYPAKNFYGSYLGVLEAYKKFNIIPAASSEPDTEKVVFVNLNSPYKASELMKMMGMGKGEIQKYNPSFEDALFKDNATVDSGYLFRFPLKKLPFRDYKERKM
jgi:hypothetical protein